MVTQPGICRPLGVSRNILMRFPHSSLNFFKFHVQFGYPKTLTTSTSWLSGWPLSKQVLLHDFCACIHTRAYAHVGTWWRHLIVTGSREKNRGRANMSMLSSSYVRAKWSSQTILVFLMEKSRGRIEPSWPTVLEVCQVRKNSHQRFTTISLLWVTV